jgi:hypothetical protein
MSDQPAGQKTRSPQKVEKLSVRSRNSIGTLHDLTRHGHKLIQAGARNDDRVTATVRFLGNTHKTASFVLPEFNVKMLTFDLELFRDNYVIHDDLEGYRLNHTISGRNWRKGFS